MEFISHRLKAAATPLRERYQKELARERSIDWHRKAEVVERLIADFVAELADLDKAAFNLYCKYNDACRAIEAVDYKIAWFDKRVAEINSTAPAGEARRLVGPTLKEELAMTSMVLAKKAEREREAPKAETVDYSLATRVWKSAGEPMTHEQIVASDEQRRESEQAWLLMIHKGREDARVRIEAEARARQQAAAAERRQWENGL